MNTEQYEILKGSAKKWNEYREENPDTRANLRGANLYGANLREANLIAADLREANLRGANLYGANLREANLIAADLIAADLRAADLREADLRWANLRGANLREADLRGADIPQGIYFVSGIGSQKRTTQYICEYNQIIYGGFCGTLAEFEKRIENTHELNPLYLTQYRAAVAFFTSCRDAWEENKK